MSSILIMHVNKSFIQSFLFWKKTNIILSVCLCVLLVHWRKCPGICVADEGKGHRGVLCWWNHISHSKNLGWINSANTACFTKQLKDAGRQRQGVYITLSTNTLLQKMLTVQPKDLILNITWSLIFYMMLLWFYFIWYLLFFFCNHDLLNIK